MSDWGDPGEVTVGTQPQPETEMSENVYDWTPEEIQAAFEAYNALPDTATVGETRAAIDAARAAVNRRHR
jgi:phosphoglycolate phosphatase-like HAD superfamily hydrolase